MGRHLKTQYGGTRSPLPERNQNEYVWHFSAADWISQGDGTVALVVLQQAFGFTGTVLRVKIGMRTSRGDICYHTFGIYRTTVHFIPNTADIILRYPYEIGYAGELSIVAYQLS